MLKNRLQLMGIAGVLLWSGTAAADLNTGLVAHWSFDDCSAKDVSGNGKDGIITAGLQCVEGFDTGKAFYFGGADFITTSYQQNNVTAYTISAWVKIASTESGGEILQNRGPAFGGGTSLNLGIEAGKLRFGLHSDNVHIGVTASRTINNAQWHHVVGVWSAPAGTSVNPDQFTLYVDGSKSKNISTTFGGWVSPVTGNGLSLIGRYEAWNTYFAGALDDIRIYERVLSSAEIQALYYQANPPAIQGTAPWATAHTVTCENSTQGTTVTIPKTKAAKWDCEKAGLAVESKDKVRVIIDGSKY